MKHAHICHLVCLPWGKVGLSIPSTAKFNNKTTGRQVKSESRQTVNNVLVKVGLQYYIEHTYTKTLLTVYLEFRFNWVSSILCGNPIKTPPPGSKSPSDLILLFLKHA